MPFLQRFQNEVSLNEISLNINTGVISPLDFKTPGQIIPDRCVPTLGRMQAVDNYNSYLRNFWLQPISFAHLT
jgi:hypothetical protein